MDDFTLYTKPVTGRARTSILFEIWKTQVNHRRTNLDFDTWLAARGEVNEF